MDDEDKSAEDVHVNAGESMTADEVNKEISPIEEAKKVLEESKKILEETKKERIRIEKATAESLINGRSYAGQKKTPEDPAVKIANEIVNAFQYG